VPFQLDQNSAIVQLRALLDGVQGQPLGIQALPANEEMHGIQSGGSVMDHPLLMLVPWAVFAVAAGLKFWRITSLFRKHLLGVPSRTERFRQALERIWIKNQQTTTC
jgi:hypothetical protein